MVPFGDTPLMCWVTTSDVSQGDELLGVYGHDYWVARALGAVPPYTPPVLQAAREWKQAIQASRRGVQTAYAEEIDALGGLFDHADADARQMARGEQAPRARPRRRQRVQPCAPPTNVGQGQANDQFEPQPWSLPLQRRDPADLHQWARARVHMHASGHMSSSPTTATTACPAPPMCGGLLCEFAKLAYTGE